MRILPNSRGQTLQSSEVRVFVVCKPIKCETAQLCVLLAECILS